MAHKRARWLHTPGRLRGSPTLLCGGHNHKWPTSGPGGCITIAALGVTNASERGTKSEMGHQWAGCLHNARRLRGPQRFRAGDEIRSGPQVGRVAT